MPGGGLGLFGDMSKLAMTTGFKIAEDEKQGTMEKNAFDLLRKMAELYGPEILPELEKLMSQQVGETSFKGTYDDEGRALQMKALSNLEREYSSPTGSIESRAAYADAGDHAANTARAEQATQQDALAARGMGNSGVAAATQQQAGQQGTQLGARMSLAGASDQRSKALQALMAYQSGAGTMRGQDYQRFRDTSEAQDAINKFNANMRWNTGKANNDVEQQGFMDKMLRAKGLGDTYGKMSDFDIDAAARSKKNSEEWSNLVNGWIDSITGMGNMAGGGGGGGMGGMGGGFGGGM